MSLMWAQWHRAAAADSSSVVHLWRASTAMQHPYTLLHSPDPTRRPEPFRRPGPPTSVWATPHPPRMAALTPGGTGTQHSWKRLIEAVELKWKECRRQGSQESRVQYLFSCKEPERFTLFHSAPFKKLYAYLWTVHLIHQSSVSVHTSVFLSTTLESSISA